jgi:hypothetical protein
LIRYIIEKSISNDYAYGVMTLMDNDKPMSFSSEEEAKKWLTENIPTNLIDHYNIKPYIT